MTRSPAALLAAALLIVSTFLPDAVAPGGEPRPSPGWTMPLRGAAVARGFEAPAHEYAPGHRGVDLASGGEVEVVAPANGVIAFAGPVAGRPVVTIDHGDGVVTSLEPVDTALQTGTAVVQGELVGTVASGGHTGDGTIHFGVRRNGEYINPLLMMGGLTRPILLPCC
ncbi:M23 family metallopeptidase [Microbacterium sp. NE2HP2]|uniref:murein hydrolase activator EnvC family protein n=1 Tax=Microbacterium plantarum TaxID=1816425 RepID=UPI00236648D1|nr:M23 family metallopeptidase [Microbacterium plantarum]MDD7943633.1 M23 family metallopeptidase [Microbacterium plantarum]WRK18764.1 M23 family metallopeptidase [Microbacterium plantarum]